jgi:propionyl-CoA synthetase
VADALGVPIIDNYWQTETGWPILSVAKGVDDRPTRLGSPGVPMPGYRVKVLNEANGTLCGTNEKGVVVIEGPLPPGCLQTVWRDDQRYVKSYWSNFSTEQVYSTFDWGIRDADGYYFILGRTDDVINVAGHRLGTREIEESVSSHENVSEVAVVGVEDKVKGQVAFAFVIPKHSDKVATPEAKKQFEKEVFAVVDRQLGAVARPAHVFCVNLLPKTRSGKLLRRSIQAICEGRDPGDLTTIEDPSSLTQIREALKS